MHHQKQTIKNKATNLKTIGKRAGFPLFALLALTAPANAFDLKLTAPDGSAFDQFGRSVALSDNTALIGSVGDDDNGESSGSAYLFDTNTNTKSTPEPSSLLGIVGTVAIATLSRKQQQKK